MNNIIAILLILNTLMLQAGGNNLLGIGTQKMLLSESAEESRQVEESEKLEYIFTQDQKQQKQVTHTIKKTNKHSRLLQRSLQSIQRSIISSGLPLFILHKKIVI